MTFASAANSPSLSGHSSSSSTLDGSGGARSSLSITTASATAYLFIALVVLTLASRLHALVGGGKRTRKLKTVHDAPSSKFVEVCCDGHSDSGDDQVSADKAAILHALRTARNPDGSHLPVDHPSVAAPLERLKAVYAESKTDARTSTRHPLDGDFLMEHSPSFIGKLGHNKTGEPLFTLGRMTFSMIRPTGTVCSLQRVTQHVHRLGKREMLPEKMPPKLRDAVEANAGELRTFVTKMYFTVEDDDVLADASSSSSTQAAQAQDQETADDESDQSDSDDGEEKKEDEPRMRRRQASTSSRTHGPRGIMRMDGYCFPHPDEPNRLAVWFSGGLCSPQRGEDLTAWRKLFGQSTMPPRPLSERLILMAAKTFMGAVPIEGFDPLDECSVGFELRRPVAAHQDVAFLDDDVRVTVGNKGTVVICSRLNEENQQQQHSAPVRKSSMVWSE